MFRVRQLFAVASFVGATFFISVDVPAGVMGSSSITNGSIGTISVTATDDTDPVTIDSVSTVSGATLGKILGIAKVNGNADGMFNVGIFGQDVH